MIELRKVSKSYPPDQQALDHLSLSVVDGAFTCIAGASGAGKSTLLKILFGDEKPSSGDALVAGRNMKALGSNGRALFRRDVGFVFQDYKLLQERTVVENIAFPLEVQGVRDVVRTKAALELLKMAHLEGRAGAFPRMLSGGEQQRVAVLRALIHRP
ncbi:MAG: ATP-binding cassette domain-containing protein, partial [Bdellovibrionales bacterium]|nr:ATP-binding cassette domain-containing protein [Bdellovibrionales bacterium]